MCDEPPNRAVPILLPLRSSARRMLGCVTTVNGDVLLKPRKKLIFSPEAAKLTSDAGALAVICSSPAANICATSDPLLTKISWTSRPYFSKSFLSLAT